MPARDFTGPEGEGPMTGRGAGNCAEQPSRGYADPMRSWHTGGKRGRGRRWRRWFTATGLPRWARFAPVPAWEQPSQEQETEALKARAKWLKGKLDAIDQRLGELKNTE